MQVWTKLFAKSPFKPLIKHAEVVLETVETLERALELWHEGKYQEMEKVAVEVDNLEDIADRIKEEIRDSLTTKLFMPVNRNDILEYLHMQDKIADAAEDTAKWLLIKRPKEIPEEIKGIILKMGKESIKAAKLVHNAILQMDTVIESGFSEKEIEREYELIKEIEDRLKVFPARLLWINPDCGLKTRKWEEVIPALTNMVKATEDVRKRIVQL